ncbi:MULTISPECIES: alkene reductase [unclassified Streptomyces]|uniref:alkene reductase n=1 Tax=unclassified Streptomyces TaxID=2593676 RepID=UPI002DDA4090|nr:MULTISPECIES: alkene reductase [unclassified Streptomyces]WSA94704.1 alkene reductase [Streptomyces sp. NBC_01795]WSB79123.1 alkene reductase [Streptomyces sp. NBC_01775]WSS12675.1 alkene reductase [Streptomyces sp. NBC_01186]WSS41459.1 alkene reductase [Streptomyces sp. NBC_01187]
MLNALWNPIVAGKISLSHRLAMAPMTRDRSTPEGIPTELNAEYYAQRASHALIITEGTQPNADGQGYLLTPGIYSEEHIAGWRKVTDAVHGVDGRIVIQLMHAGRMSHPDNTPHHRQPVAPSPVQPAGTMFTPSGPLEMPVPRELATEEVAATVEDFRRAAAAGIAAGADGVEIHGANGYLVHQFLATNTNQRTDQYGGSIDNRIRFAVEVATAVAEEIGAGRTGFRISPGNPFNDIAESDTHELYPALVRALAPLDLAYLHLGHGGDDELLHTLRQLWPNTLVLNRAGTDIATRAKDIEDGLADIVTVGVMALANPDLVERVRTGAPLNTPDPATFYGGGEAGYTDYPTHTA